MDDTEPTATEAAPAPETAATLPAETPASEESGKAGINKTLWMGTAVGIGSAALVAALLYTKRKK